MAVVMEPQPGEYSITIPVTFDYQGGRGQNLKWKIICTIALVVLTIAGMVVLLISELPVYLKIPYTLLVLLVGSSLLRFVVFREQHFSDMYERMKKTNFDLPVFYLWQIFDIESQYPYTVYYKNGRKGMFVRMEKDVITGKPDTNCFDHYTAIGNAYNVAHSLNMDVVHIDYMDNVGGDPRMDKLYDDLAYINNPDAQVALIDIYDNLMEDMAAEYACYDVYLFISRDKADNFLANVLTVCGTMLGGNYITYKIMDKFEISNLVTSLFNIHEFSLIEACENILTDNITKSIRPIRVIHGDGTVEELNRTMADERQYREMRMREMQEAREAQLKARHAARRNRKNRVQQEFVDVDEDIDLF